MKLVEWVVILYTSKSSKPGILFTCWSNHLLCRGSGNTAKTSTWLLQSFIQKIAWINVEKHHYFRTWRWVSPLNFESFFKSSRKNHKTLSRKKRPRVASTAGDEYIRVFNCSFQISASLSSSTLGNCCKENAPSEKKWNACGTKYKSRQVKIIYKAAFTDKVTKRLIPREKNKCNKTWTTQGQTQNYFNGCLNRRSLAVF